MSEIYAWVLWSHRDIMPWFGYVTALLLVALGPLWIFWAVRRAVRALWKTIGRQGELPEGMKGGEAFIARASLEAIQPESRRS